MSEANSVPREKADLGGRRLSGRLLFFHQYDVDYLTVDPEAPLDLRRHERQPSVVKPPLAIRRDIQLVGLSGSWAAVS